MGSQQGLRQSSWKAISGTATTYGGDAMAAMAAELEAAMLPVPDGFNGRMIPWLQCRLTSDSTNINDLLAEWAAAEGAANASSIGSFVRRDHHDRQASVGLKEKEETLMMLIRTECFRSSRAGAAPYTANPVNFDGTNDYLNRGADLTSNSDSKIWTISFWCRPTAIGVFDLIYFLGDTRGHIQRLNTNTIEFVGRGTDNIIKLNIRTTTAVSSNV
jgi:hypothetical protein